MTDSKHKDLNRSRNRELGMDLSITRRDFLKGGGNRCRRGNCQLVAVRICVRGGNIRPASQDVPGYYPPALTGMRGSHPGAFETAHDVRDGNFWEKAGKPVATGETYDLVVVGGGISGLAAAYFIANTPGRQPAF